MNIVGIILGILLAIALSSFLTSLLVAKSNDAGNSEGRFEDFSRHDICVLEKMDNGKQKQYEAIIAQNRSRQCAARWLSVEENGSDISGGFLED